MAQSIAYFAGFETGDTSEVVPESGTLTAQTSVVRTGGYALKIAAGAGAAFNFKTGMSTTSAIVRIYFQFTGTLTGGAAVIPCNFDDGVSLGVNIFINSSKVLNIQDSAGVTTAGFTVLSAGIWYRIEFSFVVGGALLCLLNGAVEVSASDTGAMASIVRSRATNDATASLFWDDVRIDTGGTAAIGAGQTIARQGITGTPHYDAWTKNGAATSALCWSDTPFSTATNCTDTVVGQEQTMLVGQFSTDPGRAVEGTQVIGSSDTVNACKVAFIAKVSAATHNCNILRRVGGVDTVNAVTLTTSNIYYQTPFFTDTPVNLDSYEIGAQDEIVTVTTTVYDCWMMVDYTPALTATLFAQAIF